MIRTSLFRVIPAMAILAAAIGGCIGGPETGEEVVIYRDSMGVPHVYGETARGVLYGVGYANAEDRLFELEYFSRLGKGRLAEVFGPESLEFDQLTRTGLYTEAELQGMFDALSPEHQALVRAILDGINRYVNEALTDPAAKMPYEYQNYGISLRPFTITDLVAGITAVFRFYGAPGGKELQNLEFWHFLVDKHGEETARVIFDDILVLNDPDAYTTVPYPGQELPYKRAQPLEHADETRVAANDAVFAVVARQRKIRKQMEEALVSLGVTTGASRALVVGPTRSASGHVLMMEATADGTDVHLSGGGFEVAGLNLQPMTVPAMGRTDTYGWFITTGENDLVDTYEEKLNPENPHQYWYENEWREMQVRTETIDVAGGEPVQLKVARTVHGPVVAWDIENGRAYSQRFSTWRQEMADWVAFLERTRARTLDEFKRAVDSSTGSWNVLYGDKSGHIEYWHSGRIPIRPEGVDPRLPTPGTGEYEWSGYLPAAKWPNVANPDQGYLFSWNSKPARDFSYGDQTRWGKHFRTYLPVALAESDDSITLDDLKRFNKIIGSGFASIDLAITTPDFFLSYLRRAAQDGDDPALLAAVEQIADWNELYEDLDNDGYWDHVGLTLFRKWLDVALAVVFEDDIGEWWHRLDDEIYVKYRTSLLLRAMEGESAGRPMVYDFFNGEDMNEVLRHTLVRTLTELQAEYETSAMSEWKHPVLKREFRLLETHPQFGLGPAIDLGYLPENVPLNGMPEWTVIMEIGGPKNQMLSLTPTGGQSWFINLAGEATPHIADQVMRHLNYDYKTVSLDKEEVLANMESSRALTVPPK